LTKEEKAKGSICEKQKREEKRKERKVPSYDSLWMYDV